MAPSTAFALSLGLHGASALVLAAPAAVSGETPLTAISIEVVPAPAATPEEPPAPPPPEPERARPVRVTKPSLDPPAPATPGPYDPEDPEPPTAARASEVLTAPEVPDAPPPETTFVSGDSPTLGFGFTSAAGQGSGGGRGLGRGGRGGGGTDPNATGPANPPPPRIDRSRPAGLDGTTSACENFPPAADEEDINHALVTVVVTVDRTGQPLAVDILSDPGFGFGAAARTCAMNQHYRSALDRNGLAIRSKTSPIRVRFMR